MEEKKFLYQKVYDGILEQIEKGIYVKGNLLPMEDELCEQYCVSKITVTKALKMLAEDGYVKRIPGKGTSVCEGRKKKDQKQEKNLLGVVLEHVSTPFGLEMMYHLDQMASRYGYHVLIRFSYGEREKETEEIRFLLSLGVKGLILMPCHGKHYNQEILRLCLNGFPIVLIDKKMKGIPVPSVRTDNENAIALLVREMEKIGYQRIAFLSTDDTEAESVRERRNGYISQMEKLGMREAGICSVPVGSWQKEFLGTQPDSRVVFEIRKFLERNKKEIDGILVEEYGLIPELVRALELEQIVPGEEIGIACIDEDYLAPQGPVFMHVKQDEKRIAEKAIEVLLLILNGSMLEQEDFLIPGGFSKGRR